MSGSYITGFFSYSIPLWLMTGIYSLWIEMANLRNSGQEMTKEKKATRIVGWLNLTIGCVMISLRWIA